MKSATGFYPLLYFIIADIRRRTAMRKALPNGIFPHRDTPGTKMHHVPDNHNKSLHAYLFGQA